jgi:uncharacterized protein YdeI (YjbR/CyaY-like superfamily)
MYSDQKKMKSELYISNRKQWRSWLTKNHVKAEEIWLIYYKKHTGKLSINYTDSVEEALCFGWIDGLKKRLDEQKYVRRFSPRKASSKWSPLNIEYAKKMIDEKKMTQAGLTAFNQRVSYDEEILKSRGVNEITLTPEIEKELKANKKAWENFNNLAPSYRKQYVGWLISAKKQETRQKRLVEALQLLTRNKKLGMK